VAPATRRSRDPLLPLLKKVRACTECAAHLPHGPNPLLAASSTAKLIVIGQAPGRVAHESGIPWNDRSGQRLRAWLGVVDETFYDPSRVALMPMGFCFPGAGRSGDLAPRPECAPLWHEKLLAKMPAIELTVYVGTYAFARALGDRFASVTDAARAYDGLLEAGMIVLPHPSPRNNIWLKKNPWFESGLLPRLRAAVGSLGLA